MKAKRTFLLCLAAAFAICALASCESTSGNSVALYKSSQANYSSTNGHDPNFWLTRGMTPPSTQMQ
jgi:hypothetical protein